MKEPRRHHYVPVSYLQHFTSSGSAHEHLLVLDRQNRHTWRSRPSATAYEIDFYRTDEEGPAAFQIERALSKIESVTAHSLDALRRTRMLDSEHLDVTLHFIALQAVRGLGLRQLLRGALERNVRRTFLHMTSSDSAFEEALAFFESLGEGPIRGTRAEVRRALDEGSFSMELDPTELIRETLPRQDYVFALLRGKHWSLVQPEAAEDFFITSDNPLPLGALHRRDNDAFLQLGFPWEEYYFPISSGLALIGSTKPARSDFGSVSNTQVAQMNSMVAIASRFVYARDAAFPYFRQDRTVGRGYDLLAGWMDGESTDWNATDPQMRCPFLHLRYAAATLLEWNLSGPARL